MFTQVLLSPILDQRVPVAATSRGGAAAVTGIRHQLGPHDNHHVHPLVHNALTRRREVGAEASRGEHQGYVGMWWPES